MLIQFLTLVLLQLIKVQAQSLLLTHDSMHENITTEKVKITESIEGQFWYENVPLPPIEVANSDTLSDGACKQQLRKYLEGLKHGSIWATQMFDASAKYPYGIIDGQTSHLGSFDQCYRIDAVTHGIDNFENIKGKYCLVDYKYEQRDASSNFKGKLSLDFDPNESVWEAIRERGDFRRIRRYLVQMALCIPAACSPHDVTQALQGSFKTYASKNNLRISINVDPSNCQAYHEEPEFSTGAFIYCCILLSIFTLVVAASLYDGTLRTEEEKLALPKNSQILLCFSAKRNLDTLFNINYSHRGLDALYLIRLVFNFTVVFGHRILQYYFNTVVNNRYLELTYGIPSLVIIHNGTIIVDGFFGIGGLLSSYGLLSSFNKTKRMNFFKLAFIRYIKFAPSYILLIFFYAYLFPHMGSGPQWKSKVGVEAENCAATWWANLLHLNNYMTMDTMCIFQSWYLAVDFHCYLISIILMYTFWKYPRRIGYAILGVATFISTVAIFCLTYLYRIQPFYIALPHMSSLQTDSYFVNYYVKTHLRMTPYLVGLISGAILHDNRTASYRISKRWSQSLFILLVVLMSGYAWYKGFSYYNPNLNPSSLEVALYSSLHRSAFAGGVCSVVLLLAMGDGLDFHYNLFTPRWAQPLGRLTFNVYLAHHIQQIYDVATARTAKTFTLHNLFWDFIPDIFYSFSLALLIMIGVEGPFRNLENLILKKSKEISVPPINNKMMSKNGMIMKIEEEPPKKLE